MLVSQGDDFCPYYISDKERDIVEESGLRRFIPRSLEPPPISGRAAKIIGLVVDFYTQFDAIGGMGGGGKYKMDYGIMMESFDLYGLKKSRLNIKLLRVAETTILKKGDSEDGG